jgi:large subunit ribosomal protein L15
MERKTRKSKKYRGSNTHGGGNLRRRGAGNRGGRGNAGTGKRADQKKSKILPKKYFGRHGFKSISKLKTASIKKLNLDDLDRKLPHLLEEKKAEEKAGTYSINLTKLGYTKLLGAGNTKNKYSLKIKVASKKAIEKIEKAGGKVELEVVKKPEE